MEDFGKIRGKGKVLEVQGEAEVQGVSGNRFSFLFFVFLFVFWKKFLKNFAKIGRVAGKSVDPEHPFKDGDYFCCLPNTGKVTID